MGWVWADASLGAELGLLLLKKTRKTNRAVCNCCSFRVMLDGEVFLFLEAIGYPALCPCRVGLQDPKSRQEMPGGDEVTCGTWFLLHLATMTLSVWKKIAGGKTSSSCGFGGEPGLCLGTAGVSCAGWV